MDTLLRDFKGAYRLLVNSPGFTVLAVLTLALGIGANTTIFSWVNSTLLNPIPGLAHTGNIVTMSRGDDADRASPPLSYLDYRDIAERNRSFSGLMGYHDEWVALTGDAQPERIYGVLATSNYFDVLGLQPMIGRGFQPGEERNPEAAPVAVISYDLWRTRFASDPAVLSKTIEINRRPYAIIGVAPPRFQGAKSGLRADLWIPLSMSKSVWGIEQLAARDNFWLNVSGRLKPGVSLPQAEQEMNLLMRQIATDHPEEHKDSIRITLHPLWRSPIGANRTLLGSLSTLMALAGTVLLLACANVANLFLVRASGRRRELAIRQAIGASRWQLVRQLMVESLLLGLAGGLAALLLTSWTSGLFRHFIPQIDVPVSLNAEVDRAVLLTTLVVSVLTGLLFGILPALRVSRIYPAAVLKEGGSVAGGVHKSRLASAMVVMQVALSVLLLICAGLFVRSLQHARQVHPGFERDNVLLVSIDLLSAGYSRADGREFQRQLLARLEELPGVESASAADAVPLS